MSTPQYFNKAWERREHYASVGTVRLVSNGFKYHWKHAHCGQVHGAYRYVNAGRILDGLEFDRCPRSLACTRCFKEFHEA